MFQKNFQKGKIYRGVNYKKLNLEKFKNYHILKKILDYLINASGYINNNNKTKYKEHNFKITKNIFWYFRDSKIKAFISFGSSAEYGGKNSPQSENFKCKLETYYGKDKLKCTNFLIKSFNKYSFPMIIFRAYQIYGPLQETNRLIPIASKACLFDKKFNCIDDNQIRDYLYIEDLVDAVLKAINNSKAIGHVFNLGSGKKVSIKYLISFIKNYYKKGKPIYGKVKLRKDESKEIYPNVSKIKKVLNGNQKQILKRIINDLKIF